MIVFTITRPNGDVETVKTSRTKLTVGGAYTDDITLLNRGISSEHGVFHVTEEEVIYTDNDFGTLVNDRNVLDESVTLSPGDSVQIGEDRITFVREREEASPTSDLPSSQSRLTERAPSLRPMPDQTTPGMSHTSKTYPGQTLPVPELTPSRKSSILKPVSSKASPSPDPVRIRPFSKYKNIETTTPGKQKIDWKSLANDFGTVIYESIPASSMSYKSWVIVIIVLMIVFWPAGFFCNTKIWMDGRKTDSQDPHFKWITALMIFNVVSLVLALLVLKSFL